MMKLLTNSKFFWYTTLTLTPENVVGNIYYRKFYNYIIDNDKMTKLLGSIYFGRDDIMASAVDHGRVRPHQGHRDSTEKLACWLSFVTTLLSGKSLPKSPNHIRCHGHSVLDLCK